MLIPHEFTDDELDEINAGLTLREEKLTQRIKQLDADDMPTASEKLRGLLALYAPNHRGAGLKRYFLRQSDLDDEVEAARAKAGETRHPAGQADMFGGGVAVGGGFPAGEVVEGAVPRPAPVGEVVEADYEIVDDTPNGDTPSTGADAAAGRDNDTGPAPWDLLSDGEVEEWSGAGPYTLESHESDGDGAGEPVVEIVNRDGALGAVLPNFAPRVFSVSIAHVARRVLAFANKRHAEQTEGREGVALPADATPAPLLGRTRRRKAAPAPAEPIDPADPFGDEPPTAPGGAPNGGARADDAAWDQGPAAYRPVATSTDTPTPLQS